MELGTARCSARRINPAYDPVGITPRPSPDGYAPRGGPRGSDKEIVHMGAVAAFEAEIGKERQMEGIAKAKAAGVYKGRKPSVDRANVRRLHQAGVRPSASEQDVNAMKARISGQNIGVEHTAHLTAIPLSIRIYIDSYRSQLISKHLWEKGLIALNRHLDERVAAGQISDEVAQEIWDRSVAEDTARTLAIILAYALARTELMVVKALEARVTSSGTPLVPNSYLFAKANPFVVNTKGGTINLFEFLAGSNLTEESHSATSFLDIACDGVVFAPEKVNRKKEVLQLQQKLRRCKRDDLEYVRQNISSIPDGIFYPKGKKDCQDFGFSENFVDELAYQVGTPSRYGRYSLRCSYGGGLKEKGVDCDLIMKVMDDLQNDKIDVFVFVTHDGDFAPLVRRLVEAGETVFIVGLRDTDSGYVSNYLLDMVEPGAFFDLGRDDFISFVAGMFMTGAAPDAMQTLMQWDQLNGA